MRLPPPQDLLSPSSPGGTSLLELIRSAAAVETETESENEAVHCHRNAILFTAASCQSWTKRPLALAHLSRNIFICFVTSF